MFRIRDDSQSKENVIVIQGKQVTSEYPVSTIMFQNYDTETNKKYDMVALSCYDHHNDPLLSQFGDLSIRTVSDSNGILTEKLRIHHNGIMQLGQNADSNALLNVGGDLSVKNNIIAQKLQLNKIEAQTKKIIFKNSVVSDSVLTLNVNASNIDGVISQDILPEDVVFNNVNVNNNVRAKILQLKKIETQTKKLIFKNSLQTDDSVLTLNVNASNIQGIISPNILPDTVVFTNTTSTNMSTQKLLFGKQLDINSNNNQNFIYFFKEWSNFPLSFNNVSELSNIIITTSEYRVINNTVDMITMFDFVPTNSNLPIISYSIPYGENKNEMKQPSILYNKTNNTYDTILSSVTSNNIKFYNNNILSTNNIYEISLSLSYIIL